MSRSPVSRRKTDIIRHLRIQYKHNKMAHRKGTLSKDVGALDRWFKYLIEGNLKQSSALQFPSLTHAKHGGYIPSLRLSKSIVRYTTLGLNCFGFQYNTSMLYPELRCLTNTRSDELLSLRSRSRKAVATNIASNVPDQQGCQGNRELACCISPALYYQHVQVSIEHGRSLISTVTMSNHHINLFMRSQQQNLNPTTIQTV